MRLHDKDLFTRIHSALVRHYNWSTFEADFRPCKSLARRSLMHCRVSPEKSVPFNDFFAHGPERSIERSVDYRIIEPLWTTMQLHAFALRCHVVQLERVTQRPWSLVIYLHNTLECRFP
ncbi:unnamed protein product [Cercospora beticola]|nr:unnamed protein product [Cercospora beticola]